MYKIIANYVQITTEWQTAIQFKTFELFYKMYNI